VKVGWDVRFIPTEKSKLINRGATISWQEGQPLTGESLMFVRSRGLMVLPCAPKRRPILPEQFRKTNAPIRVQGRRVLQFGRLTNAWHRPCFVTATCRRVSLSKRTEEAPLGSRRYPRGRGEVEKIQDPPCSNSGAAEFCKTSQLPIKFANDFKSLAGELCRGAGDAALAASDRRVSR
jgi:hypothetical protein